VEDRIGDLEIRRYEERAVAETRVDDSDWDRALDEGSIGWPGTSSAATVRPAVDRVRRSR
jgi:hypothetical protein